MCILYENNNHNTFFFVGLVAYLDIKNSYKPVIEKQSLYSQLKYFSYVLELNTHF